MLHSKNGFERVKSGLNHFFLSSFTYPLSSVQINYLELYLNYGVFLKELMMLF